MSAPIATLKDRIAALAARWSLGDFHLQGPWSDDKLHRVFITSRTAGWYGAGYVTVFHLCCKQAGLKIGPLFWSERHNTLGFGVEP